MIFESFFRVLDVTLTLSLWEYFNFKDMKSLQEENEILKEQAAENEEAYRSKYQKLMKKYKAMVERNGRLTTENNHLVKDLHAHSNARYLPSRPSQLHKQWRNGGGPEDDGRGSGLAKERPRA